MPILAPGQASDKAKRVAPLDERSPACALDEREYSDEPALRQCAARARKRRVSDPFKQSPRVRASARAHSRAVAHRLREPPRATFMFWPCSAKSAF
ncbi:hypothetical protein [Lysobacter enzymogenes]|uniref:hypothetical protein n=1 Tax=Lysobacter enzymogenes TaxID=69 RepID=UPI001A974AA0|nr:hypothetical protein [Lysobacter enzymogenes]QQP95498.1 hypothetical protein JHW38_20005 [Lysobacter enzymogenes]